ncbi:hypothetical protein O0544_10230 [Edwardsiella anguillarum]|nr:hypothetical protein [Edwardsiella anguillarum]
MTQAGVVRLIRGATGRVTAAQTQGASMRPLRRRERVSGPAGVDAVGRRTLPGRISCAMGQLAGLTAPVRRQRGVSGVRR